jgi:hypothetical protein
MRRKQEAHNDREIFAEVLKLYRSLLRRLRHDDADKRLYAITIGTLGATKLMLRFASDGELEFHGDRRVWESIEQMSDGLAEEHFELFRSELKEAENVSDIRLKGEREYLHLVKDRTIYRWSREMISDDEPVPIPIARLEGAQDQTRELIYRIMTFLGEARVATAQDKEQATHELLAQVIGVIGLSKLLLALFGNGKVAATLERLADMCGEHEYRKLAELS